MCVFFHSMDSCDGVNGSLRRRQSKPPVYHFFKSMSISLNTALKQLLYSDWLRAGEFIINCVHLPSSA